MNLVMLHFCYFYMTNLILKYILDNGDHRDNSDTESSNNDDEINTIVSNQ